MSGCHLFLKGENSIETKKRFKKKPFINKSNDLEDKVVYRTKGDRPVKKADWQLKLQAISMCMSNHDGEIINSEVENIYQGLIHRTK